MAAWRQESWVALQRGEHVDPRWSAYGEYARLRGEGLREQALQAASRCATSLAEGDEATRWDFTSWLCRDVLSARTTLSMVLPHPLETVVLEALWHAHAQGSGPATRWLVQWFPVEVMASRDYATDALGDFLREGLAASPADEALQGALADHLLAWVRTDVADLAHDRYDGDPRADLARLAEAETLVSPGDARRDECAHLRQTITNWKERSGP
jgi:hypothetical protein